MAILLNKKLNVCNNLNDKIEFINKIDYSLPNVRIGILNLMPNIEDTECHFLNVLDNPVVQIELDFIYFDYKNIDKVKKDYFKKYYKSFLEIKNTKYDGMIITGAPLEHLNFNEIDFYNELSEFFLYTQKNVKSTIFLCWASEVGINYFYGINKYNMPNKLSGLYKHNIVNKTNLVKNFDDYFYIPQSRYCGLLESDVIKNKELILVSSSDDSGIYIVQNKDGSKIFLTGHAEYDLYTLDKEYKRDVKKGIKVNIPKNYYFNNKPIYKWRAHATLLYHNWINYYLYKKNSQR